MCRPTVALRPILALTCLVPLLFAAAACDSGGGSPTAPSIDTASGTASLKGEVTVSGQAGGSSTSGSSVSDGSAPGEVRRTAPTPGGPGGGSSGVSSVHAADSSGGGVTISIAGTSLSTVADQNGLFRLDGLPAGHVTVIFDHEESSASITINGVQPNESISVQVTVSGSSASVDAIDRQGEEDEGEEDAEELELELDIQPDDWNLNYEHSSGTVQAFIGGAGFEDVLLDTIRLVGDDAEAAPLTPLSASRQGNHVRARFAKSDVLDLLASPEPGSNHLVALVFEVDGVEGEIELTEEVTVQGADDGEDNGEEDDGEEELGNLELQISPDRWNTNYPNSSGNVTAFVRGDGLDAIDLDSIELVGDDPEATPLPASFARLEGNHVRAQFPKSQVLGILDSPNRGTEHTVVLSFTGNDGADTFELDEDVKIVGAPAG